MASNTSPTSSNKSSDRYLLGKLGKVSEYILPNKAVITFNHEGQEMQALLLVKNLFVGEKALEPNTYITAHLKKSDTVMFDCHIYDNDRPDKFNWFVAKAWKHISSTAYGYDVPFLNNNLVGRTGTVSKLNGREGILSFSYDEDDEEVYFTAAKFYAFGKRMDNKSQLGNIVVAGDFVQFDATPVFPCNQNLYCKWTATLVWKGKKPEVPSETPDLLYGYDDDIDLWVTKAKTMIRVNGYVSYFISGNAAVAKFSCKPNQYNTAFFQLKDCVVNNQVLRQGERLANVLTLGSTVALKLVQAPIGFPTQWIAREVYFNNIPQQTDETTIPMMQTLFNISENSTKLQIVPTAEFVPKLCVGQGDTME